MRDILVVLGGYTVCRHPGDRYTKPYLYVQGRRYVHPILFEADGRVWLKDADEFEGPRQDFTAKEVTALREWYAELRATIASSQPARLQREAAAAQRAQVRHATKLARLAEPELFD